MLVGNDLAPKMNYGLMRDKSCGYHYLFLLLPSLKVETESGRFAVAKRIVGASSGGVGFPDIPVITTVDISSGLAAFKALVLSGIIFSHYR
jgi:hypothetical protein